LLGSCLLTKILADFLFGFYLLNSVLKDATNHTHKRYAQLKKPAAQTAHLVFADTKANAEKTKRAVFCQRSKKNEQTTENRNKINRMKSIFRNLRLTGRIWS
jgi:hypothetical protein